LGERAAHSGGASPRHPTGFQRPLCDQAGSDLSAKGKPPIQVGLVRQRNNSWLFGFSKELLPLDATDKDVQFNVRTGANLANNLVHATFNPKDMTYRGALAL
jgi:hypothetical protein